MLERKRARAAQRNSCLQRHTAVAAMAVVLIFLAGAARAASVADWRHAVDGIVDDVRATHPDPFRIVGRLTFLRAAEKIKADAPSLSEEQRMVRVMQLVAMLGDGHSALAPYRNKRFAWWYPIRIYQFSDGYFVTSAYKSVAELAGARVLEIDGKPADLVVRAARSLHGGDNDFYNKERLDAVSNAALMMGLGFAASDRTLTVKFKLRDRRIVTRRLSPYRSGSSLYPKDDSTFDWRYWDEMFGPPFGERSDWISAYKNLPSKAFLTPDATRPPHLISRGIFVSQALPKKDAYYIQVNAVEDGHDEGLVAFFRHALKEVDGQKPRNLILDLRYNFGGDGSLVPAIVGEFLARKNDKAWKNLYVLTGRRTYSAAVLWVGTFLKYVAPVTLIGEPPGSPLNTFGDTNAFYFKKVGIRLYVSYERHEQGKSTDLSEYIPIDVPAPFSFADYAAGRDPAVDPILAGREMRGIPVIALESGAAAARKAYRERLPKFSRYKWWRRPTEPAMRQIMFVLRDHGEMDRAIAVGRLDAEINPSEWRSWYNLGDLQFAAGWKKDALDSYRRCLALNDPTNFNKSQLERRVAKLKAALARK
jgi:hypothetical protein